MTSEPGLTARLLELRIGALEPLAPDGPVSGIDKRRVSGPLALRTMGLAGDQQADRRHHGGPDKALHHYPAEHYAFWCARLPDRCGRFVPGGFGENLSSRGLTEDNVHVGDLFRIGGALVQVSQGRQPCWKLNLRFGVEDMARRVQEALRTGWYYRVLEPGAIAEGDTVRLVQRPEPQWPLRRLLETLYGGRFDQSSLEGMAELVLLAEGWREIARRRLARSAAEDWSRRVETPRSL